MGGAQRPKAAEIFPRGHLDSGRGILFRRLHPLIVGQKPAQLYSLKRCENRPAAVRVQATTATRLTRPFAGMLQSAAQFGVVGVEPFGALQPLLGMWVAQVVESDGGHVGG